MLQGSRKRIGILMASFAIAFLAAGCGTPMETITFSPGKKPVVVTLDSRDSFSLSNAGGTILVRQKGKIMLQGAFITKDIFEQTKAKLHETNLVTIYQEEAERVVYDQVGPKGVESRFLLRISDTDTYVLFASWLPREAAERVLDKLSFKEGD